MIYLPNKKTELVELELFADKQFQQNTLEQIDTKANRAELFDVYQSRDYWTGYADAFQDFIVNGEMYPEL